MRFPALAIAGFLVVIGACIPPSHLGQVTHSRGGRSLPDLFLGGWDSKRLRLFDDTSLTLGVSTADDVVVALSKLSNAAYGTVFIDSALLDPAEAERRGFFCDAPWCVVVFDRGSGRVYAEWGEPLAIFELSGVDEESRLGAVWLVEKAIRPPGPTRWALMCRDDHDKPRFIHPDGNAYFPARPAFGEESWARFGESELAAAYLAGTRAPSETTCDFEEARAMERPPPEMPDIDIDPSLLEPATLADPDAANPARMGDAPSNSARTSEPSGVDSSEVRSEPTQ